jgi:hypothetical protein
LPLRLEIIRTGAGPVRDPGGLVGIELECRLSGNDKLLNCDVMEHVDCERGVHALGFSDTR